MSEVNNFKDEVNALYEGYVKSFGFAPNTLVLPADIPRGSLRSLCTEDTGGDTNTEDPCEVMGMNIRYEADVEKPYVCRIGEGTTRLKPRGAKAMYMPMADITNMLPSVISAAFHSMDTDDVNEDAVSAFATDLASFLTEPKEGLTWEKDILPRMENMLKPLSFGESYEFLSRFFFCMMDFYWYCLKHIPVNAQDAEDYSSLIKTVFARSLIRSVTEGKRKAVIDELTANGKFPENALD